MSTLHVPCHPGAALPTGHAQEASVGGDGAHPDDRFAPTRDGRVICHRVEGHLDGPVVVLVAGLLQDLLSWPEPFLDSLVETGFCVVRLDNRDVGRSSPAPTPAPSLLRQVRRKPRPDAYLLEDMADDVADVLDHLAVQRAHVVGASMGAMIAQCLAAGHPERVLSLTSLWSTTGAAGVGTMASSTRSLFLQRPPRDRGESVTRHVEIIRHIAGTRFPMDAATERVLGCEVWDRASVHGPDGAARQIQAITASGDRTAALRTITAPTLVVHGAGDLMVDVSGGRATAEAVPGARLVEVPGLGHHLSPAVVEPLASLVTDHVRSAESRAAGVEETPPLEVPRLLTGRAPLVTSPGSEGRTWGARAVVTGAAGGLGREFALQLCERGGRVVCADVDEVGLAETVRLVEEAGGHALAVTCDVTSSESVHELAVRAEGWFGPPTLLVNNAGLGTGARRVGETPLDVWRRATDVNLWGAVLGCEEFLPRIRRTGGPRGVITVASAASFTASPGMGAYNVGKAGAMALAETLAAEFACGRPEDEGLASTVLCPTFVETGIFDGALMDEASARYARERAARIGTTAADVVHRTLDAHDRGTLLVLPTPDARRYWRLKRLLPATYPRLAARAVPGETMNETDSTVSTSSTGTTRRITRTPRSPRPVALPGPVQPRQSLGALLAGPVVLGAVAGLALGWAAPAYWMLQLLAVVLTPVGVVKTGARAAFGPALLGGAAFGLTILAVRALTGWPDVADIGMDHAFLPLVTALVGGLLGAWGGARNARR